MDAQNIQINQLLQKMVSLEASDLFLSSGAAIQIRVNGTLQPLSDFRLLPGMTLRLASQMLTPAEIHKLQDLFEMNIGYVEPGVGRFRINFFKQRGEIAVVARHIKTVIPSAIELGLPEVMQEKIMSKNGLILVVGATGSGKSTTLASLINHRSHHEVNHIVTLEDPIEYMYAHGSSIINQREIGLDTLSWDEAMKNVLRQSPDVVVIGEIRTRNALEHAIAFADTGHLCLTTLHSTNACQAFERIINFFPKSQSQQILYDLSHSLRAILCQRLVPSTDGRRRLATECLINSPTVREIIKKGEFGKLPGILRKSDIKGMHTFDQSLLKLYQSGQITEENALTYADSENDMRVKLHVQSGKPSPINQDMNLKAESKGEQYAFNVPFRTPGEHS